MLGAIGALAQVITAASSLGTQSAIAGHQCQATLEVVFGLVLSLGFQKFAVCFQRPGGFFLVRSCLNLLCSIGHTASQAVEPLIGNEKVGCSIHLSGTNVIKRTLLSKP